MFCLGVPRLGVRLTRRVGFPALGSRSMVSHEMARSSYSRFPHMSQIQAGKFGTMISSSPSQVKYVMSRICMTPALHSRHGYEDGELDAVSCSFIVHSTLPVLRRPQER